MKKVMKRLIRSLMVMTVLIGFLIILFRMAVVLDEPPVENRDEVLNLERHQLAQDVYACGDSWIRKNKDGQFELYVTGSPFEMGYKHGLLAKELVQYQEEVFVERLREMIPSESYLNFLKYFIAWFNKDMDEYVPLENQEEIYGVAQAASPEFEFIAPAYHRILNYHGAHDIGHALQNLNLVACTALGTWGSRSADSSIIIGRNFDFHMGDEFARDKIVGFYKPNTGHPFMTITWGGMTGVVSGLNMQGLTITLNSAKTDIPLATKLPVSLLARQILQYAGNIEEAIQIAQSHDTFVSESFLIGSAADNKVVVIEKSPDKMGVYDPGQEEIILTNHFQGDTFKEDELTKESREEGASLYRYKRVAELMRQTDRFDVAAMAQVLRDQGGLNNASIGMGNERAINQLIAHHSVIFKPQQRQVWVSANPYQLGRYVAYDLNMIFNSLIDPTQPIADSILTLPADPFLTSAEYTDFREQQQLIEQARRFIKTENKADLAQIDRKRIIALNPDYYYSFVIAGQVAFELEDYQQAATYFKVGLEKEIPRIVDRENLEEWLAKTNEALAEK